MLASAAIKIYIQLKFRDSKMFFKKNPENKTKTFKIDQKLSESIAISKLEICTLRSVHCYRMNKLYCTLHSVLHYRMNKLYCTITVCILHH